MNWKTLQNKMAKNKEGLVIWGALIINMILVFIQRLYIGVMSDYVMKRFSLNLEQLSFLTSTVFYGYAIFQIPAGILIDRIGIRKLNIYGSITALIGSAIFAFATGYEMACVGRFLVGAGTAVVITSILKVQVVWFAPVYFSHLSAGMALFSNVGNLAGTLPLAYLIGKIGEQNTLYCIVLANLFIVLFIFKFIKDKKGETRIKNTLNQKDQTVFRSLKDVFTNKATYPPLILGLCFISTGTSLMSLWGIKYFTIVYGMSKIEASSVVIFFTFGFLVGAPLVSIVERAFRGNYKKALIIFTGIYMMLWGYFLFIQDGKPPVYQLPVLCFLMGVVLMFHLLPFTAVKEANNIENAGVATSVLNTMEFIGSGLLNFLIASFLERGFPTQRAFIFIFIFSVISFIAAFFIQFEKNKKDVLTLNNVV